MSVVGCIKQVCTQRGQEQGEDGAPQVAGLVAAVYQGKGTGCEGCQGGQCHTQGDMFHEQFFVSPAGQGKQFLPGDSACQMPGKDT